MLVYYLLPQYQLVFLPPFHMLTVSRSADPQLPRMSDRRSSPCFDNHSTTTTLRKPSKYRKQNSKLIIGENPVILSPTSAFLTNVSKADQRRLNCISIIPLRNYTFSITHSPLENLFILSINA